jgi:hypothetical protein
MLLTANPPLQQTGRASRLLARAATGCGRQLSGIVVRQRDSGAPTRSFMKLCRVLVSCVLVGSVLVLPGCFLVLRSGDSTVAENLELSLRASTGYYAGEDISFELFFNSTDGPVWPSGRAIRITANGEICSPPRDWSLAERFGTVDREYNYGYRRCSLWHMSPRRLAEWLGGPGRYSIQVSVGPASSNAVVIECMPDGSAQIIEVGIAPHGAASLSYCLTSACSRRTAALRRPRRRDSDRGLRMNGRVVRQAWT